MYVCVHIRELEWKLVEKQTEGREQKVRAYDHQNRASADGL